MIKRANEMAQLVKMLARVLTGSRGTKALHALGLKVQCDQTSLAKLRSYVSVLFLESLQDSSFSLTRILSSS